MVRFARAEGSLGCNKRVLEEATPWAEMVAQRGDFIPLETSKKRKQDAKEGDAMVNKKKKKNIKIVNEDIPMETNKKRKQDAKEGDAMVPKKKKKKSKSINNEEKRDVKCDNKLPAKKEMNEGEESMDIVASNQPSVQPEGNSGENEKQKKKKGEEEGVNETTPKAEFVVNAKGQRVKVFRDGTERTWFDLPYEENERMTRYDNMWVKKDMVGKLNELKTTLKDQGLEEKKIMRQMMKAKRKAHRQLRIELIYEQKRLVREQQSGDDTKKASPKKKNKKKSLSKNKEEMKKTGSGIADNEPEIGKTETIPKKSSKKTKKNGVITKGENDGDEDELDETGQIEMKNDKKKSKKKKKGENDEDEDELNETGQIEMKNDKKKSKKKGKNNEDELNETGEISLATEILVNKKDKKKSKKVNKNGVIKEGENGEDEEELNETDQTEMVSKISIVPDTVAKKKDKKKSKKKNENGVVKEEVSNKDENELYETNQSDQKDKKKSKIIEENGYIKEEENEDELNGTDNTEHEEQQYEEQEQVSTWDIHSSSKQHIKFSDGEKNIESEKAVTSLDFKEDDFMTNYEGYWVMRTAVERLNSAKEQKRKAILDGRNDGSQGTELTREESIALQRIMKKEKRFEHKKLIRVLVKGTQQRPQREMGMKQKMHGDSKGKENKSDGGEIVKFDGFWVKKESADRLTKLREKLMSEGLSEEELKGIMQKERRKEERLLKTERQLVCLKCRKPGHMVSACPQLKPDDTSAQVDICYTCGSTEHTSKACTLKKPGSEFSLATCYICGETGHISRQCPDNPRGLYPNGGACRGCGSVEHLARDCPDLKVDQAKENVKAEVLDGKQIEALETPSSPHPSPGSDKKKVKKIKFS